MPTFRMCPRGAGAGSPRRRRGPARLRLLPDAARQDAPRHGPGLLRTTATSSNCCAVRRASAGLRLRLPPDADRHARDDPPGDRRGTADPDASDADRRRRRSDHHDLSLRPGALLLRALRLSTADRPSPASAPAMNSPRRAGQTGDAARAFFVAALTAEVDQSRRHRRGDRRGPHRGDRGDPPRDDRLRFTCYVELGKLPYDMARPSRAAGRPADEYRPVAGAGEMVARSGNGSSSWRGSWARSHLRRRGQTNRHGPRDRFPRKSRSRSR